ncbi:hypothetical protein CHARACLAT_029738 [Characodon lateralis]|uniref:Uncharacterized protein n=1 Tax=Characodon lateralis TaxID=208331 RepID=A0ABU7F9K5_9TELE|nr:hypothetical protein [Characodon lateralis]
MMKMCKNPTKHNTTEKTKRIVARYPKSLQDVIDGNVSLTENVQTEKVPPTPFIIVCDSSSFAAETFVLSINKKIVIDCITTFTSAICLMLGSSYCFNIHCPVELQSTLEFLQQ